MRITTNTVFKGGSVDNRTKLVAVSLFRMKSAYRDFEKYLRRAIMFINQADGILNDWIVRIYVDQSVKEDELKQLHFPHVELVLYHCDEFWDSKSGTHEGVFGMLPRFLPCFSAKKYEIVGWCDVDVPNFWLESFKWFETHAVEVGIINSLCYSSWVPRNTRFPISGGFMFTRVVFPRQLFATFLKKLYERKIPLKIVKSTDANTYVPYGVDEYLLNTTLYSYIEEHKIKVLALTTSTVISEVRRILKNRPKGVNKDIDEKIEKHMAKLDELDRVLWKNPRNGDAKQIEKHIRDIIDTVEPEFEELFYTDCMAKFFKEKKTLTVYKYNY